MNMKKPLLGVIGVAGACAACCAFPLAIPLIAGMSAGGLASVIGRDTLTLGAIVPAGAAGGAALLVGAGIWWSRRRKAAACQAEATTAAGSACSTTATSEAGASGDPAFCAPACACAGGKT